MSSSRVLPGAVLAAALLLGGCVVPVPIPSRHGSDPYPPDVLAFLGSEATDRAAIVERLGEPHISRRGGTLLVYGAARERGMRLLLLAPPFIPATIPEEEYFYLFLELTADGVLLRHELVSARHISAAAEACSSWGVCVLNARWSSAGVPVLWARDDRIKAGERAVVTASAAEEAESRLLRAPVAGCMVYLFGMKRKLGWRDKWLGRTPGSAYFGVDDQPLVLGDPRWYQVWALASGARVLRAQRPGGAEIARRPIDCRDGEVLTIAGVILPTAGGFHSRAVFEPLTREATAEAFVGRRLLLR